MAKQKFEIGATVKIMYLNMPTTGKIRAFNSQANYYDVYIPMIKEEMVYTARELEQWN